MRTEMEKGGKKGFLEAETKHQHLKGQEGMRQARKVREGLTEWRGRSG